MAYSKFSPTEADRNQLSEYFTEHGPSTLSDIMAAFGWYREKANSYLRLLDCNVVGFRHEKKPAGYSRPSPLYAFEGDHVGGYCMTCKRKLALVPKGELRSSQESKAGRVREQDCRSCRMVNVHKKNQYIDQFTGEVTFEDAEPTEQPCTPTKSRPGSDERITVLATRVASGLTLWHPDDMKF